MRRYYYADPVGHTLLTTVTPEHDVVMNGRRWRSNQAIDVDVHLPPADARALAEWILANTPVVDA